MQLAGGRLLFTPSISGMELAKGKRTGRMLVTDAEGREVLSREVRAGSTAIGVYNNGLTTIGLDLLKPISQDQLLLFSPSGKRIAIVDRAVPPSATMARATVEVWRPNGTREAQLRFDGATTPVDNQVLREIVRGTAERIVKFKPGAFRNTD